jgi:hypothetical protein
MYYSSDCFWCTRISSSWLAGCSLVLYTHSFPLLPFHPDHGETGPEGSNVWERTISMIDFNMSRPSGADLSRFKSVLYTLQSQSQATV